MEKKPQPVPLRLRNHDGKQFLYRSGADSTAEGGVRHDFLIERNKVDTPAAAAVYLSMIIFIYGQHIQLLLMLPKITIYNNSNANLLPKNNP